ncbi:hypothetical protein VZT92_003223 [Zoarces viviparus]|uniref:Uncharacterized protein n=1 Tax=Zoarces viviparus TaxID=48416 RepID=A0AAW1G0J9_ZOAVI
MKPAQLWQVECSNPPSSSTEKHTYMRLKVLRRAAEQAVPQHHPPGINKNLKRCLRAGWRAVGADLALGPTADTLLE